MNSTIQPSYPSTYAATSHVNAGRRNKNLFQTYSAPANNTTFVENAQAKSIAMNNHTPHTQPQSQPGQMQQQQQQPHTHTHSQHQQHHTQQKFVQNNPLHPSLVDKLDPAFVKLHNSYIAAGPPPSNDINVVRANYSALYSYATAPATGVGGIGETTVPGWEKYPGEINIRVYVPPGEEPGKRKVWPVHFNFHGGGWACGDLETSAHICHHICAIVPCCVIDISYRLIPDYPFPVGIYDSLTAVAHILVNHRTFSIDPYNVTFGGESSGGTIALVLNHVFRDAGQDWNKRLKGVIVGTPTICDLRRISTPHESPFESMRESEFAPLLDWRKLKWFDTLKWMSLSPQPPMGLTQHEDHAPRRKDSAPVPTHKQMLADISWYANLLTAPSHKKLAPLTYIATAEIDPLRDEGEAYALKLRECGNNVVTKRFRGVPHPFMHMDGVLRQGREYVREVIGHIRVCLYPPKTEEDAAAAAAQQKNEDVAEDEDEDEEDAKEQSEELEGDSVEATDVDMGEST